jgi:hypothetical protein
MAGMGPQPKDPRKRARVNKDQIPTTVLSSSFDSCPQPSLPRGKWPARTRAWWKTWGGAAQAELFTATDWEFLMDTATLHAALWDGNLSVAPELRLRVAKFGATMEDRARLRIQFAAADDADAKRPATSGAAERYADLRVLPASG